MEVLVTTRPLLPLLLLGLSAPAFAHDHRGYDQGRYASAPTGTVVVLNRAGTAVTVQVPGQAPRVLAPWETAAFRTVAGEATIRSSYWLFGQSIALDADRVYVAPGRSSTVVVEAATTARVLVANRTPVTAQVLLDGRELACLAPGQERVLTVPARPGTLSLLADGHLVRTARLEGRPYDEPRFTVEMPRVGDVVAYNPLPIPVQLVPDRGAPRTVEAYGRTVFDDVPVGSFHVSARRLGGELVDDEVVRVDPWVTVTWRVDAPRDGLVDLDNDHWLSVRVYVDGRLERSLGPDVDTRLLLPLGWHHVEVRDDAGREIVDTWVEVDRYDTARVRVGRDHDGYRGHDGYRDERREDGMSDGRGEDHEDDGRYDDHRQAYAEGGSRR